MVISIALPRYNILIRASCFLLSSSEHGTEGELGQQRASHAGRVNTVAAAGGVAGALFTL